MGQGEGCTRSRGGVGSSLHLGGSQARWHASGQKINNKCLMPFREQMSPVSLPPYSPGPLLFETSQGPRQGPAWERDCKKRLERCFEPFMGNSLTWKLLRCSLPFHSTEDQLYLWSISSVIYQFGLWVNINFLCNWIAPYHTVYSVKHSFSRMLINTCEKNGSIKKNQKKKKILVALCLK